MSDGITDDKKISFLLRCRNADSTLNEALQSLEVFLIQGIEYEIVCILHLCTDKSLSIINDYKLYATCRGLSVDVNIFEYNVPISRAGLETLITEENHPNSLITYYNWCFNKVNYSWVFKWDADFVMNESVATAIASIIQNRSCEKLVVHISTKFSDGNNAAAEPWLSNCQTGYTKTRFWEVPRYSGNAKFITLSDVWFLHNDNPRVECKEYWKPEPWFNEKSTENYGLWLSKRHDYVLSLTVGKPEQWRDCARSCNPNASKLSHIQSLTIEDIDRNLLEHKVTLVITACGRPDLLRMTLTSFIKHNTSHIHEAIIIEDSGKLGINDFTVDLCKDLFPVKLLYNDKNIGQMASIDKAYTHVTTEYIFHLEEDWLFTKPGFIEKSAKILDNDSKICTVWLRPHNSTSNHPIVPMEGCSHKIMAKSFKYTIGKNVYDWCGFTFNPGLRKTKTVMKFGPYADLMSGRQFHGTGEYEVQCFFRADGFYAAVLDDPSGYVNHIGWGRHITRKWDKPEKKGQEKRNDWFVNYQGNGTLREVAARKNYFTLSDFKDSSVMDAGCNIGKMSEFAVDNGASLVWSIDYDQTAIKNAKSYQVENSKYSCIQYLADDLDSFLSMSVMDPVDVSMFLSVVDTVELNNSIGILSRIASLTKKVMYFEGHNRQPSSKYVQMLLKYTTFTQIECRGRTYDRGDKKTNSLAGRPFIRASRERMTSNDAVNKLMDILTGVISGIKNVAVVGRAGSGKSLIRRSLVKRIEENDSLVHEDMSNASSDDNRFLLRGDTFNIIDDIPVDKIRFDDDENITIWFDYRALQYMNTVDVVIVIHRSDTSARDKCRPMFSLDRSSLSVHDHPELKMLFHVFM
jgi:hypothetical protein